MGQGHEHRPTGKERIIYGTYTVSNKAIEDCREPVLSAADAQPAMPELDQAAKNYSAALDAWGKTLVEANTYYERENFKDDAMAKGKAMHGDIVKHYAAFDSANQQFSNALETENDKRQLKQLAEIEKTEGRKYTYWQGMTMFTAKKAVNSLSEDKVDLAKAEADVKAFEETADALNAYAKTPDAKMPMMYSMMESDIERYRVAAKKRLRAARDNSQGDSPQGEGSRPYLVERYNALVQTSNRQ
nr:YiiG family protein [Diaphorobacter aerolatus]